MMSLIVFSPILALLFLFIASLFWRWERPFLWFAALLIAAYFGWAALFYAAGIGCELE
jgi:hypothetical protein